MRNIGLYDMTMLRFEADQRVGFREYKRVDVTCSYFFSLDSTRDLFLRVGFIEVELEYCCRQTGQAFRLDVAKQKATELEADGNDDLDFGLNILAMQVVGDMRMMRPSLLNPVFLVENHQSCRKNRDGQKVLQNGQTWRPQLFLLCSSMKILNEANSIQKAQEPFDSRKIFGFRVLSPQLPYMLSLMLQSCPHPKLSNDQDGVDSDLVDLTDSDNVEDEDEYDQHPPFKPPKKPFSTSMITGLLSVETTDRHRPGLFVDLVKIVTDISVAVESGEFDSDDSEAEDGLDNDSEAEDGSDNSMKLMKENKTSLSQI
ncbi:hypothetical protein Tco_1080952 [Tanacetum coccineum]|uniref:Uncharacterized protein n=1 Tax=Tanacetum coccineum TaxID=301880 RepID=A0ABQ5HY62_9ASTR